ncbi:MAG: PTS-dependent dihydroxyacetone kinase phosphotransferase subunit DhaM [Geminicoccaceae bacterium]|nr:PTS-dependent dihydroxyacetone kinase phosphotransferase subunit DhaM [Geminicoccaceae bacterium]
MTVGIVVVSHSAKVAEGTADMVRGMVGEGVPVATAGGDPDGGLGTDVAAIKAAIERVWDGDGVAVLVDLGSAEMGGASAIELLDESRRALVRVCRAPLVEGAVVAATVADGGASLDEVVAAAEAMRG